MHYVIMKWNPEVLKWEIVHYSHLLEDMEAMMIRFPQPDYVHLIDLKWIKSHEIMEHLKTVKERINARVAN